jgi:hypothetical protein
LGTFGPGCIAEGGETLVFMRTRKPDATTPEDATLLLPMVDTALQQMVGRGIVESTKGT